MGVVFSGFAGGFGRSLTVEHSNRVVGEVGCPSCTCGLSSVVASAFSMTVLGYSGGFLEPRSVGRRSASLPISIAFDGS